MAVMTDPGELSAEEHETIETMSQPVGRRVRQTFASVPTWILWLIVIVWTIPTLGLFV